MIKYVEKVIDVIGKVKVFARTRFEKITGVSICTNHRGKMAGMWSLSTLVTKNPFCMARSKTDSICAKCFAQSIVNNGMVSVEKLARNTDVLTNQILDVFPTINHPNGIFRLESFGDLINEIQFINYLGIINSNPQTTFSIWSKNLWIIDNVFKSGYKKPSNLIIIQSSVHINKPDEIIFEFVDKLFTVYTKEYATKHGIKINCGSRHCLSCMLCYTHNDIKYINELLK